MARRCTPALLALILVLSACGGGGGAMPGGGTPAPQTPVAMQRAIATQALSATHAAGTIVTYAEGPGQITPASAVRKQIDAAARRVTSAWTPRARASAIGARPASVPIGPCVNGVESATVPISSTEVQIFFRTFYDAACTQLYQDIFFDIIATSPSTATATGTIAVYSSTGTAVEYDRLTLALSGIGTSTVTFSILNTFAQSSSSPPLGTIGVTCVQSTPLSCGAGAIGHNTALNLDSGATLSATVGILASASAIAVLLNGSSTTYTGPLYGLTLAPGGPPAWNIAGGTIGNTVALNGQLVFSASFVLISGSLTLTDAVNNLTANVNVVGSPVAVTGTIKQMPSGNVVASFTINSNGSGTITYSDGTTVPIMNWIIIG